MIRPDTTLSHDTIDAARLIDYATHFAALAGLFSQQALSTACFHLNQEARRTNDTADRDYLHAAAELLTHYMEPGTEIG